MSSSGIKRYFLALGIFMLTVSCLAQNADIRILRQINLERNSGLDPTFVFISDSSTPLSMAVPIAVFGSGFIKKDSALQRKGLYIAGSMAVSAAITLSAKYSINRPRPYTTYPELDKLGDGGSPSFPSGHTSNAFATATALTFAFPKWYVAAPAFAWAGLVGYSRMHLGVHYPSDVLVGAAVGAGSAWLCHWLNHKLNSRNFTVR